MATRNFDNANSTEISRRKLVGLLVAAGVGSAHTFRSAGGLPTAMIAVAQGDEAARTLPADAAKEQVLRVATGTLGGLRNEKFPFSPLLGGNDIQNWQTLMWIPPMYFDVNQELQPGIFMSWVPNDDFTMWTFSLDPRAEWSDDTPITATDVKGTWELMADPLTEHGRIKGYIGRVVGFDAVRDEGKEEMEGLVALDERTLQVSLATSDPVFHWRVATTHMNPVKIEQAKPAPTTFWLPENNPAFSGPYVLAAYDIDRGEAELVPNPNWWMEEGPYLDRITFRYVADQQILGALVQNGEVDVTLGQLPQALADEYPDFFRTHPAIGFNTFWINTANEPTDDINVRKALVHSVNFEEVFLAAYPGGEGAQRATQLIDMDLSCVETQTQWYAYDPEAARAALAESRYGSAENLPKIRVTPRSSYPPLQRALEAIIESWRQNLGIVNVEFKTLPDEFGPDAPININRDDVVIRFPDSATYMWTAAHSEGPIAQTAEAGGHLGGYQNAGIDSLLEEALVTPVENSQRCELTLEAQRLFMEDYPVLLLADEQLLLNARDYVKNYDKGPDTTLIEPWTIYIAEH